MPKLLTQLGMPFQCQKAGCRGKNEGVLFPIPLGAAKPWTSDIKQRKKILKDEEDMGWRGLHGLKANTALSPMGLLFTSSIPS